MKGENEKVDGVLIVDIDGTLCEVKKEEQFYSELAPKKDVIERLRMYHEKGYYIVLFTSRNMNSFKGSIGKINKHTAPVLLDWLEKWEVPFDEILFGKPWPRKDGFYIDDRAVRPDEFLRFDEGEIHALLAHN